MGHLFQIAPPSGLKEPGRPIRILPDSQLPASVDSPLIDQIRNIHGCGRLIDRHTRLKLGLCFFRKCPLHREEVIKSSARMEMAERF
jgi:hypothetical protein